MPEVAIKTSRYFQFCPVDSNHRTSLRGCFCPECGVHLVFLRCSKCSTFADVRDIFCVGCGASGKDFFEKERSN